jgi:hypothetical protein
MKAITIKQPWVYAILCEGKDIENRSWRRSFRGWLAIHASAQPQRGAEFPRGIRVPDLDTLDYSAIVGSLALWTSFPRAARSGFGIQTTALPTTVGCSLTFTRSRGPFRARALSGYGRFLQGFFESLSANSQS